jgi:hypothetical protein
MGKFMNNDTSRCNGESLDKSKICSFRNKCLRFIQLELDRLMQEAYIITVAYASDEALIDHNNCKLKIEKDEI